MHFWTKVGSAAKTWGFLLVPNVFWNAKEEGGGWWRVAWKAALHNPVCHSSAKLKRLNIRKGELLKLRSLCLAACASHGCKFGQECYFVASFMPIICILSPPLQFPFSATDSAGETPNKISGQGSRSSKKTLRPIAELGDNLTPRKIWHQTIWHQDNLTPQKIDTMCKNGQFDTIEFVSG